MEAPPRPQRPSLRSQASLSPKMCPGTPRGEAPAGRAGQPAAATFARGQRGPCPRLLAPREPALSATWLCCGWGRSWDGGGAVWRSSRAESWAADRLPLVPKARITSAEKAAAAFGSISGQRATAAGSAAPPAGARRGGGGGRPLPGGRLREGGTGLRPGPVEHLPGTARRPRKVPAPYSLIQTRGGFRPAFLISKRGGV